MYSLLLVIIYFAFISLGLPDSLVGSAWPIMHQDLQVPLSYAGIITMIIAGGTIVSSLFSDKLTKKFGTGLITAVSVLTTAVALFGFSLSNHFILLCLWAIPYGLGAGAVDAALNNYVALHYASRHMNWLHCFWGVGAAVSPYIMSFCLTSGRGWHSGYQMVGIIQILLTLFLFISLPLWKRQKLASAQPTDQTTRSLSLKEIIQLKGAMLVFITFFSYCALEATTGLWASSYLVQFKEIDPDVAASFASLFYLGITFGRFVCGFVADHLGDSKLIRIGLIVLSVGIVLLLLPLTEDNWSLAGLILIGIGCAPIYPAIIHSTPQNFGKENSQAVIGVQMASAYLGATFMPPLFGALAALDIRIYPFYLLFFAILMLFTSEKINRLMAQD